MLLGGELQIDAKNSNYDIFESALYIKCGSMPFKLLLVLKGGCLYLVNEVSKKKKKKKKADPYFPIFWVGQKRANKHLFLRPND